MVEKFVDKDAKKGYFNSRMRFCKRSVIAYFFLFPQEVFENSRDNSKSIP